MKRDQRLFLKDILEASDDIAEFVHGMTKQKFLRDRKTQLAVIRQVSVIGEAAKNLSPEKKESSPRIPWRQITGMRDMLIHEYFGTDLDDVWNTAKKDIPKLKRAVKKLLG